MSTCIRFVFDSSDLRIRKHYFPKMVFVGPRLLNFCFAQPISLKDKSICFSTKKRKRYDCFFVILITLDLWLGKQLPQLLDSQIQEIASR